MSAERLRHLHSHSVASLAGCARVHLDTATLPKRQTASTVNRLAALERVLVYKVFRHNGLQRFRGFDLKRNSEIRGRIDTARASVHVNMQVDTQRLRTRIAHDTDERLSLRDDLPRFDFHRSKMRKPNRDPTRNDEHIVAHQRITAHSDRAGCGCVDEF